MSRSPYARRFDLLAHQRADMNRPRAMAHHMPDDSHAGRVQRALACALRAGIAPNDAYPAVFRKLAALGLMLRPIHFMPAWVPAMVGTVYGALVLGLCFALAEAMSGVVPALANVRDWGQAGLALGAPLLGAVAASLIRAQALRARLPRWSEI